jgi:hypothetical protein
MEIKLINYSINIPDVTWQFGGRGREREAERRGEAAPGPPGWRVESVGESRETERERERQRESRDGEKLESGERWRDRDKESGRETGKGWRVESVGSRASRHSAVGTSVVGTRVGQGVQRSRLQPTPAGAARLREEEEGTTVGGGEAGS